MLVVAKEALLIHDDSSLTLLSSLALQNPPLRAAQKQQQVGLAAGQQLGNLGAGQQQMAQADIQQLMGAGGIQQQLAQQALDAQRATTLQQQFEPFRCRIATDKPSCADIIVSKPNDQRYLSLRHSSRAQYFIVTRSQSRLEKPHCYRRAKHDRSFQSNACVD